MKKALEAHTTPILVLDQLKLPFVSSSNTGLFNVSSVEVVLITHIVILCFSFCITDVTLDYVMCLVASGSDAWMIHWNDSIKYLMSSSIDNSNNITFCPSGAQTCTLPFLMPQLKVLENCKKNCQVKDKVIFHWYLITAMSHHNIFLPNYISFWLVVFIQTDTQIDRHN